MSKLLFIPLVLCIFLSSCRRFKEEKVIAQAEPFRPTNIYPVERLPLSFARVVLLPCYHKDPDSSLLSFCDDIFFRELSQERIFEIIQLSPRDLAELVGKPRVSSLEPLPASFLKTIESKTFANGVLFVDLDSYRPYRPMSLGVRAKLVDLKSGEFMWAIDETFDAGHADIIVGTTQFQEKLQVRAISDRTGGSVLHSPRIFTKYVASTIFSTLPKR